MLCLIPLIIGIFLGVTLKYFIGWWAFTIIFPWIGGAISIGIHLQKILPRKRKHLGRKIANLLILPILLLFVPIINRENFQLEGVILIVLVGYFSKGFIHYAIAKLFGPLIWGRGFCGWGCWTAAILDWLPIKKGKNIPAESKNWRYLFLFISILLPVVLVVICNYDVKSEYIGKAELSWMITGNIIYYLIAIPMAFFFHDKRAFCKIACPVSLVMKVPTRFALIRRKPSLINKCTECGICNKICNMDIDVMSFITKGHKVNNTECILCGECTLSCPVKAIV